jgi:hypothetical protein
MPSSTRCSFGLPVFASLLLHGVVFGTMLLLSARGTTSTVDIVDTQFRDSSPGMVLTIVTETKVVRPPETKSFEVTVDALPVAVEPPHGIDAAPVVVASPGNAAIAANKGTGAGSGGLEKTGGHGNGNSVFAAAPTAKSVVYLVDRSGSMGKLDAFRRACAEVVADLCQWPETTRFQVVTYNTQANPLCINASVDLLPLNVDTVQKAQACLSEMRPTGWTDHLSGLRKALLLSPDVLYLVTDADDLNPNDVRAVTTLNYGRTVIHTIEMSSRCSAKPTGTLAQLAKDNRGTYRRVLLED